MRPLFLRLQFVVYSRRHIVTFKKSLACVNNELKSGKSLLIFRNFLHLLISKVYMPTLTHYARVSRTSNASRSNSRTRPRTAKQVEHFHGLRSPASHTSFIYPFILLVQLLANLQEILSMFCCIVCVSVLRCLVMSIIVLQ